MSVMKSCKLIWGPEQDEKLVDFVKPRGHIWNNKNPYFSKRSLRKKDFIRIAAHLGNNFTSKAVKLRWTNIRSTFMHNYRRIVKSTARSDLPEDIFKPSWHLWERCQFLVEAVDSSCKEDEIPLDKVKMEFADSESMDQDVKDESFEDFLDIAEPYLNMNVKGKRIKTHASSKDYCCLELLKEAKSFLESLKKEFNEEKRVIDKNRLFGQHVADSLSMLSQLDAESATGRILEILASYGRDKSHKKLNFPNVPDSSG